MGFVSHLFWHHGFFGAVGVAIKVVERVSRIRKDAKPMNTASRKIRLGLGCGNNLRPAGGAQGGSPSRSPQRISPRSARSVFQTLGTGAVAFPRNHQSNSDPRHGFCLHNLCGVDFQFERVDPVCLRTIFRHRNVNSHSHFRKVTFERGVLT